MCQGYYNHAKPYRPQWEGLDRFQGAVVYPQRWPEDLDLAGQRVVVIGSGATAATLIPAVAGKAEHVTMLQRSPSYYFAPPTTSELAMTLRALDIPAEWTHEILRRQYISWSDPENFSPGYVMRSQHILYKQGDREPWTHMLEQEQERDILPEADLDDGTLVYR